MKKTKKKWEREGRKKEDEEEKKRNKKGVGCECSGELTHGVWRVHARIVQCKDSFAAVVLENGASRSVKTAAVNVKYRFCRDKSRRIRRKAFCATAIVP